MFVVAGVGWTWLKLSSKMALCSFSTANRLRCRSSRLESWAARSAPLMYAILSRFCSLVACSLYGTLRSLLAMQISSSTHEISSTSWSLSLNGSRPMACLSTMWMNRCWMILLPRECKLPVDSSMSPVFSVYLVPTKEVLVLSLIHI